MKALKYTLYSYAHQQFTGILASAFAILIYIGGFVTFLNVDSIDITSEKNPWFLFFLAVALTSFEVATHLKRMLLNNCTTLLPDYRKYQVLTAGIIMFFVIILAAILTWIKGIPVLLSLSLFLSISTLLMWLIFRFDENIFVLVALIWSGRFLYEAHGVHSRKIFFEPYHQVTILGSSDAFFYLVIFISLISFYYFMKYLLNFSLQNVTERFKASIDNWTKDFDYAGPLLMKILSRRLPRALYLFRLKRSFFNYLKITQYSLFSPINSVMTLTMVNITGALFYISTYILIDGHDDFSSKFSELFMPFSLLAFCIVSSMLSVDFQQHRGNLKLIWMSFGLYSRKSMVRLVAFVYLLIALKIYAAVTAGLVIFKLLFVPLPWFFVYQTGMIGLFIFIFYIPFSMINSDYISSADCRGWTITNIVLSMIAFAVAFAARKEIYASQNVFFIVGVLAVISIILLFLTYRKWLKMDIDFTGPEMSTSG